MFRHPGVWFLLLGLAGCAPVSGPADLVLFNGTIVTLDDGVPEARALAARGAAA